MNLERLVLFGGIILVSGGCADRLVGVSEAQRPSPVVERLAAPTPVVRIMAPGHPAGPYIRICECDARSVGHAPPLVVVDGRRMTQADILASGISPQNIADISLLKGHAAVEQYGPAAAEGVVVVTLKH